VTRPPAKCNRCQTKRVAWTRPRVDYCYDCLPGGPFPSPPCRCCDSDRYFSEGLCDSCHPGGPSYAGSCRGCLAWGVYRAHGFRCWSCRWWHTHYPVGDCLVCGRNTTIGEGHACRLCLEQARTVQEPGRAPNLAAANQYGQQLFLANMRVQRPRTPRLKPAPKRARRPTVPAWFKPLEWRQLALFEMDADPQIIVTRSLVADSDLIRYCKPVVAEHSARHGWSKRQRNDVIRSLRLLQVLQDTPGAKINAIDVLQLPRYSGSINSTLEVLAAAGLLNDDRPTHVERYFAAKTGQLPEAMKAQLNVWLEVMLNGSHQAPRQRSRDPQTARIHIMGIAPIIAAWADAGHRSLAEITAAQVRAALPAGGSRRNWAEYGLRSLLKVLKARKLIFANPTRGMRLTPVGATVPLPLDGRHIPLAGPVKVRLAAWLDHRARTWPATANPHLFINNNSGPGLTPVAKQFPWRNTNLRPQALREDRILQKILASGGDVRRICDLFGTKVETAMRYATILGPPQLLASNRIDGSPSSRID
jgi:hypothetical protein